MIEPLLCTREPVTVVHAANSVFSDLLTDVQKPKWQAGHPEQDQNPGALLDSSPQSPML